MRTYISKILASTCILGVFTISISAKAEEDCYCICDATVKYVQKTCQTKFDSCSANAKNASSATKICQVQLDSCLSSPAANFYTCVNKCFASDRDLLPEIPGIGNYGNDFP